jgi:hypothetical protein
VKRSESSTGNITPKRPPPLGAAPVTMKMVTSGSYAIRNTRKRLRRGPATHYLQIRSLKVKVVLAQAIAFWEKDLLL